MKSSTLIVISLLILALLIGFIVWWNVNRQREIEESALTGCMHTSRVQTVEHRNGDTIDKLVFHINSHWQKLFEARQVKTDGEAIDPESWVYRVTYQTLDDQEIVCLVCPDGIVIGEKNYVFKNSDGSISDHIKILDDMYENLRNSAVA